MITNDFPNPVSIVLLNKDLLPLILNRIQSPEKFLLARVCKRWNEYLQNLPDPLRKFQSLAEFYSPIKLTLEDLYPLWHKFGDPFRTAAIKLALSTPLLNPYIRFASEKELERNRYLSVFEDVMDPFDSFEYPDAESMLNGKSTGDFILWLRVHELLQNRFHDPRQLPEPEEHQLMLSSINDQGKIEHRTLTKDHSGALWFGKTAYPDLNWLLQAKLSKFRNPVIPESKES